MLCFVFFFKQKTAYEMRISDWSSDVCSSDLRHRHADHHQQQHGGEADQADERGIHQTISPSSAGGVVAGTRSRPATRAARCRSITTSATAAAKKAPRSEEHTSELQSLMRISYAVFCLKQNNRKTKRLTISSICHSIHT